MEFLGPHIMKDYPSIPPFSNKFLGRQCIAFRKEDGSNIRIKWSIKKGWHLFGTRHRLFDHTDKEFGCVIELWHKKYAKDIDEIINTDKKFHNVREIICYCEFLGPFSFGGQHDIAHPALQIVGATHNNPKDIILFDVNIHKKGLMSPLDFINAFENIHTAEVIYKGVLDTVFVQKVKEGDYSVVEGVVIKGGTGHTLWMTKIKTLAYLEELKRRFATDWEKYL